mgnify:CR=1 FL=1
MRSLSLIGLLLGLALVFLLARTALKGGTTATTSTAEDNGRKQSEVVKHELESSLDAAADRLTRGLEQAGAE